jgi:hypothetical protein
MKHCMKRMVYLERVWIFCKSKKKSKKQFKKLAIKCLIYIILMQGENDAKNYIKSELYNSIQGQIYTSENVELEKRV